MTLKQVTHFTETNTIEATWVDADGNQAKCHSYADVQMDMLQADLGTDAAQYADLISKVKAGIKPYIAPPPVIPVSLTMRQARLSLLSAGLLDAVQSGVSAMPKAAQIEWEFAATVDRTSPLVFTLAAALGLNDAALDALFSSGAEL